MKSTLSLSQIHIYIVRGIVCAKALANDSEKDSNLENKHAGKALSERS